MTIHNPIEYDPEPHRPDVTRVYLEGKLIGHIRQKGELFTYFPKGETKGGEPFLTLRSCKASLEAE